MFIIDVATPRESVDKKAEKISKYQDIVLKISRMLNTQKTRGIPNVIGDLETESLLTECLVITRKGVRM